MLHLKVAAPLMEAVLRWLAGHAPGSAELLRFIARLQQCWVILWQVGTEAGARFWGGSRVLDPGGHVVAEAPLWEPGPRRR